MKKIPPIGNIKSKICIIGEMPSKDDNLVGLPFTGSTGKLLRQLLSGVGIDFNECYATSVVKYYPPNGDILRIDELGISLLECISELEKELQSSEANVFIPLGSDALKALTGHTSIFKYRGSILKSTLLPGRKVIGTIHPASLLKEFQKSALVSADFKRIKYESEFPDFRSLPVRSFITNPDFATTTQELDRLLSLEGRPFKKISLDIETTMNGGTILCVGLSDNAHSAICIPFVHKSKPYWPYAHEVMIWEKIKRLLTSPNHYKIIQNAQFEMDIMFPIIGEITPVYMDTMIGQHLLYPELPKGLDTLCSLYTNEPYYKDDAKIANYESDALWNYNCKDVCVTFEIAEAMDKELEEDNLTSFLHGYQMPFQKILWQASHFGIKLDIIRLQELKLSYIKEADTWQKCLNALVGKELNTNSPNQVRKLLYTDMKLPPHIHRKTGQLTVDNEAIERLDKLHPNPIFKSILKTRGYKKMVSTYMNDISDKDGRVRTNWVITGTETGRLSSRKNIRGTGSNLQNFPKEIRDVFVADEGYSFVVGDLSQVEARFVAWLSGDNNLKSLFKKGGKIHSHVASWLYKVSPELVTPEQYAKAKSVVHGCNYDMGFRTFSQASGISIAESKWLLNQYHNNFPMIKQWHQSIVNQLHRNRTLTSPFGRRRLFFGWWGDSLFKEAYATVPQACAVDLLCMAAVRIYYQLPPNANILLQVHDEIVIQCMDKDIDMVAKLFKAEVEKPVIINGDSLSIPLDIKIGKNWKDLKEYHNG